MRRCKILLGNGNSGYGFSVASASLGWDYFVVASSLAIYIHPAFAELVFILIIFLNKAIACFF